MPDSEENQTKHKTAQRDTSPAKKLGKTVKSKAKVIIKKESIKPSKGIETNTADSPPQLVPKVCSTVTLYMGYISIYLQVFLHPNSFLF